MDKLHKETFIERFLIVTFLCIVLICLFLSWNEMRVEKFDISGEKQTGMNENVVFNIEKSDYEVDSYDGDMLTIIGWGVIVGREPNPISIHILLRNEETNEFFKLPTVINSREDVTAHFNDGINYNNSGFSVHMNGKALNFDKVRYEIVILYEVGEDSYVVFTKKQVGNENKEIE